VVTGYYDQTCETLTGSTIPSAKRDGIWLVLSITDREGVRREFHLSGRTTKGKAYCGKCGEDRMIQVVRDRGMKPQSYCDTCAHSWELVD
jgi:hypothetical protein